MGACKPSSMLLDMTMNPRNCPCQFPSPDTKEQGTCRARAKSALRMGSPKVGPPWVVPVSSLVSLSGHPRNHMNTPILSHDLTQGILPPLHLAPVLCASSWAKCKSGEHLLYILKTQALAGSLCLGFPQRMMDVSSSADPFSTG